MRRCRGLGRSGRVEPSRSGSAIAIASCSARVLEPMFIRTPFQTLVRTHGTAPADCDSQPYGALQTSQDRDWPSGKGGPPTGGRPRFATSADLARVAGRVSVAPGASVAVFRSLHTHFIELQPSHTLEQDPFLVLAKQRWNVSGACRPLDDARIRPIRRTYVQARSPAAAEEGAGVTAGFGAAVRGGSAVTTRATPKIASPPPMSTTPVTGSDKITAPNNTATAGLT